MKEKEFHHLLNGIIMEIDMVIKRDNNNGGVYIFLFSIHQSQPNKTYTHFFVYFKCVYDVK